MVYNGKKVIKTNTRSDRPANKAIGDWRNRIWNSNIFSFFLVVLLILSFIKVSKEILIRYEINNEIKELEGQLGELENKSKKMEQLVAYLNTEEYIEKQARIELNLSKPGEKQIFLADTEANDELDKLSEDTPNAVRWFNYFFN